MQLERTQQRTFRHRIINGTRYRFFRPKGNPRGPIYVENLETGEVIGPTARSEADIVRYINEQRQLRLF